MRDHRSRDVTRLTARSPRTTSHASFSQYHVLSGIPPLSSQRSTGWSGYSRSGPGRCCAFRCILPTPVRRRHVGPQGPATWSHTQVSRGRGSESGLRTPSLEGEAAFMPTGAFHLSCRISKLALPVRFVSCACSSGCEFRGFRHRRNLDTLTARMQGKNTTYANSGIRCRLKSRLTHARHEVAQRTQKKIFD